MMVTTRFTQRRLTASLTIALIAAVASFEVPFPQTGAQIRSSIVSNDNILATSPRPLSLPLPIAQTVKLSSGTTAEIISCRPKSTTPNFLESLFGSSSSKGGGKKPVLAFLHGSFHASWCWAEHYMPFFADKGYECVSLSLQGTGGTPAIPQGSKKVQIASHVADFNAFLAGLSNKSQNGFGLDLGDNPQVVLIGHSFGGLTIMKWLEEYYSESKAEATKDINLAGVGLLCSVPPSGNGPMTLRYLFRSLKDSYKITVGFAMKKAIGDKVLCRELFFGGDEIESGISDEDLERYQSYFERDTVATIDLKDLAGKLPSKLVGKSGDAPFVDKMKELPLRPFVMGATNDFIVDKEGVIETGNYLGLDDQEVYFVDSPHDVMLGRRWENGANAILDWIQGM